MKKFHYWKRATLKKKPQEETLQSNCRTNVEWRESELPRNSYEKFKKLYTKGKHDEHYYGRYCKFFGSLVDIPADKQIMRKCD